MNTFEVDALFAQTLLGDYEGEPAWEAVSKLRLDGSREIFERSAAWCLSDNPLKKARAADILCQLRRAPLQDATPWNPEWLFRDESYTLITTMLESEQYPLVLASAICALGHLDNESAIPLILRHQNHPDRDVRLAVSVALGSFPNDPQSIGGLLTLTSDPDAEVRDWAVFGLGVQGDVDSPKIREALFRCLNDANVDVREEALVGLAKRHDQRVLPILRALLGEPLTKVRVTEAAAAFLGLDNKPPDWNAADYEAALSPY